MIDQDLVMWLAILVTGAIAMFMDYRNPPDGIEERRSVRPEDKMKFTLLLAFVLFMFWVCGIWDGRSLSDGMNNSHHSAVFISLVANFSDR